MWMNLKWFLVVVLAALLQSTWPEALKLQDVLPDLTLILVVWFAIVNGEERGMFTGALGGLYLDVAGNTLLGHHVLCLVLAGFVMGRVSTRLITEHPAVKVGLVFLAEVFQGVLFTAILYVQKPDMGFLYMLVSSVAPAAFYTALISPLFFMVLGLVFPGPAPFRPGVH